MMRSAKALLRRTIGDAKKLFGGSRYQENPWQQQQNQFMTNCLSKHCTGLQGVLHVGGHFGEEYAIYKSFGAKRIVFFEPVPKYYNEMARRLGRRNDVVIVKQALGSAFESRKLHINRGAGESTSFLSPTALYDGFFEEKSLTLDIRPLDSVMHTLPERSSYDLLVTDTQGFDLEVLKGAKETLKQIRYVYTEVSEGHYHGEPPLSDIDNLLIPLGFERVEHAMYGSWKGNDRWGDVFYAKSVARAAVLKPQP